MTQVHYEIGDSSSPAGLPYHGSTGITNRCLRAIQRLLQTSVVARARVLSSPGPTASVRQHGFLLLADPEDYVVVLPGFSSGYAGEGPRGLSQAIALLREFDVDMDELVLSADAFARLRVSALTNADLETICSSRPTAGTSVYDYLLERHLSTGGACPWDDADVAIPFPILHPRVRELALRFWTSPDATLTTAFRRLEDSIRQRSGLQHGYGRSLINRTFGSNSPRLIWAGVSGGETTGRAARFASALGAYRNPRMHSEPGSETRAELLRELLAVNELYFLLDEAVSPPEPDTPQTT